YLSRLKGPALVQKDGNWQDFGDEAFMLSQHLDCVIIGKKRCKSANLALAMGSRLLILDDGFQHRAIARNLVLVLIKEEDLKDRLFPFGKLREPIESLRRASAILISYSELNENIEKHPILSEKPIFYPKRINFRILDSKTNEELKLPTKERFYAFSALGDNEQFFKTLERLGIEVYAKMPLRDHFSYENFRLPGKGPWITTQKDLIKLKPTKGLYYLTYDLEVPGLIEWIISKINAAS
ncbi:MAG: tetraacyldisaccharide 4'-kinase, partial [Aquificaceae bacterium]|nr:tetraacyldisaccharide 4'-kinase [Aquificaceae bacterium]